jgi:sugar O-acyltransferase (sialic acid O-acetyltransferase NeuD family)
MRKALYFYGAGGFGREVLSFVRNLDQWEPRGFLDDMLVPGTLVGGIPVVGGSGKLRELAGENVIITVGSPLLRKKIALRLEEVVTSPVILHPGATILDPDTVKLGRGTIITAGVVITTNVSVGNHVLVNLNATIGHDSVVGSFTAIMPGVNISGNVSIGESVLLGAGSNVRNGVVIEDSATVGMGAVVLKRVSSGDTVGGVPAVSLNKQ